jgi:hypothetical protein
MAGGRACRVVCARGRSSDEARLAYLTLHTPPVGGSCGSGGTAMAPRGTTAKTAEKYRKVRETKLTALSR